MKETQKIILFIALATCMLTGSMAIASCASSPPVLAEPTLGPDVNSPTRDSQIPTTIILGLGTKQSGQLIVSLFTSPNSPVLGSNTFEVVITDLKKQPISGALVSFDTNMTNMNMGKNVVSASTMGAGRYCGTVYINMLGQWRMFVNINYAGQTKTVQFNFNVNKR